MSHYALWYGRVVWTGITVNMLFVIALAVVPSWFLGLLKIPLDQPIWGQIGGMLLFIISLFYVPGAVDPVRYRLSAWMHVVPSRTCGAVFFLVAVLFFGQPLGFLSIALVDAFFGAASLYCLVRMTGEERAQRRLEASDREMAMMSPQWLIRLILATLAMLFLLILGSGLAL